MPKRLKLDLDHIIERGRLAEKKVGLTEFVGTQRPFIGVLKHRYEDFLVNEVDKDGNIVHLTDINKPQDVVFVPAGGVCPTKIEPTTLPQVVQEQLAAIELMAKKEKDAPKMVTIKIDNDTSKDVRKLIHQFFKQNYEGIESSTQTVGNENFIKVQPIILDDKARRRQQQFTWPPEIEPYVHFTLYKENIDTVNILNELAKRLHCSNKSISYAGHKDKRAITVQRVAIWKTSPAKIWQHARHIRTNGGRLRFGDFSFGKEQLRLGELSGNHFEIVLRNVRLLNAESGDGGDDVDFRSEAEAALDSLANVGFINYFGMQRFGSQANDSHQLGVHILRRDFKALVEAILEHKSVDARPAGRAREAALAEALNIWRETGDASAAFKRLTHKYSLQGQLLRALSKTSKNDYHGALCLGLARNSRTLYLHAYQSYIWNRVASERVRKYGLKVTVGDLVFVGPEAEGHREQVEDEEEEEHNPAIKWNIPPEQIVHVTEENIDRYNIYDVVLPIPGAFSKMPKNEMRAVIDSALAEDGLAMEDFGKLSKQWCVNGAYRKVVIKPNDLCWKWIEYVDDKAKLIESDLDRIEAARSEAKEKEEKNAPKMLPPDNNDEQEPEIALKLSVTLPTSCYATVMLRELTKVSSVSLENKPWMLVVGEEELETEDQDLDV